MKTAILYMLLAALLPVIRANFGIYTKETTSPDAANEGYIFVPANAADVTHPPSCNFVKNAPLYYGYDDVSWRTGIRVAGDIKDPDVIEFNTPLGHYSE
jgi:hypothetical protein